MTHDERLVGTYLEAFGTSWTNVHERLWVEIRDDPPAMKIAKLSDALKRL